MCARWAGLMRSSSHPRNLTRKKSIRMKKFVLPGEKSSWMMAPTSQSLILGLRPTCSTFFAKLGRCTLRPWGRCQSGMSRSTHGSASADCACLHGRRQLCANFHVPTALRKRWAQTLWLLRLEVWSKRQNRSLRGVGVSPTGWRKCCALSSVARALDCVMAGGGA